MIPDLERQMAIRTLLRAQLDSAGDRAIGDLVNASRAKVHLVCDLTHELLAMSDARERECSRSRADMLGVSLWPHASEAIVQAESRLSGLGWFDRSGPAIEIDTGAGRSMEVAIAPSRCRWTRLQLSDGRFARLVQTLEADLPISSIQATSSESAATSR